jgi:uncharacterized LabA/DUF88 family protein
VPPQEPAVKRVHAFIDGQNLFHSVGRAFRSHYPDYDPHKLTHAVCASQPGWTVSGINFYTGVPDRSDNARWHHFWSAKLAIMGTRGVRCFRRSLRYNNQTVAGAVARIGHEKGIDVRIALDVVKFGLDGRYDVALIFSQDQDLSEAVEDVKEIARLENRWIKVACALPAGAGRGINNTDWIRFDRALYNTCIDPNDYRPATAAATPITGAFVPAAPAA